MRSKPDHRIRQKSSIKNRVAISVFLGTTILLFSLILSIFSSDTKHQILFQKFDNSVYAKASVLPDSEGGLWDGPILYHKADSEPIHLVLIEKALQKLHLYRFDGRYKHIKSYACATGEQQGKKKREKDEKTPEGIYFNVKAYRDSKITIFGDRAFGLNYPDVFDKFEGNKGSGIFIHSSNKSVKPFSTNGCVVLNIPDLADLDRRIQFKKTPVIIGESLPYRFKAVERDVSELIPFFKQAMIPERYAQMKAEFRSLTVLGFDQKVVAVGELRIKEAGNLRGISRLYLAGPGKNFLVLLKRQWDEVKLGTAAVTATAKPRPAPKPTTKDEARISSVVESWRKAWENKSLNAYISHYHPAFKSDGKNLSAWKHYKGRLNKRYRQISVKVSDLKVKKVENRKAFAYFKQRYRSDTFHSNRYKRLEFKKKGLSWKIYRERTFPKKPAGWPT